MKAGIKTYTDREGYEYLPKIIDYVDFVEILPVPDNDFFKKFLDFDIQFRIHAPHQGQGADPADRKAAERTKFCINKAIEAAELFNSPTIVVHPGAYHDAGALMRSIDFLNQFKEKKKFLIENLPAEFGGQKELGGRAEDIKKFMGKLKCGMCFDFGHASLTTHTQKIEYKDIIKEFLALKPKYFHIMGGSIRNFIDHKELFWGDFDINFFRKCIPKDAHVALETPHDAGMQKKEIHFLRTGEAPKL